MLVRELKYETKIKCFKDVSPDSVKSMLREVQREIGSIDLSFEKKSLTDVLAIVEKGEYQSDDFIGFKVNLESARSVIKTYRRYSEGGCQSCVKLGRETIDAQDASSGWYCRVEDPDYNYNHRQFGVGVRYAGFSPKIKRNYKKPCEDWEPEFKLKLEEILGE